ncbi:MAG: alpha-amylase family glycosyl hydrolase [Actinomycetota bacterium]|nr:alpha-amylase family glycosyl hydrolase [Actinomycetota bacterium]
MQIHRTPDPTWWQRATIYQVYPRSFAESAGHPGPHPGVGTLAGFREHIAHLAWLGVDAVWLSPVFVSPMADFGYDVADFCAIDPSFGTLADFDELLATAHAHDIKVLLDWVPNHTSDQHPWFQESRRDRTNPKADWYVWRDEPANNWLASFPKGEAAWQYDDGRGQYYLRCFLKEQPDLNWDNPEVEAAMHDTLRYWLDRGVDGFRMDVVHLIGKDLALPDPAVCAEKVWGHVPFNDQPITHDRLRRIRAVLDEYGPGERVSVGEVYLLDEAAMAEYYGTAEAPELHLSFNFRFLWAPFDPAELRNRILHTTELLADRGAWPTWVLSNHDVPRHRQRYGGRETDARMAAIMLLTLPGTPFIYQGEELGLVDADVPPERVVDPGLRDGCRAPIPWNGDPLHGWAADPWLPFAPEADTRNVAAQMLDEGSMLHFYRRLLQLRRTTPALQSGAFTMLPGTDGLLAWRRSAEGDEWFTYVNPTDETHPTPAGMEGAMIVICSDPALEGTTVAARLPPRVAWVACRRESMDTWVASSQS